MVSTSDINEKLASVLESTSSKWDFVTHIKFDAFEREMNNSLARNK